MGLDWVASPHPAIRETNDSPSDYEYDPVFRAQRLLDSELPTRITDQAMEDMTYWEMSSYTEKLESHIENEAHSYDDDTEQVVRNAVTWLRYWSKQEKQLYAAY